MRASVPAKTANDPRRSKCGPDSPRLLFPLSGFLARNHLAVRLATRIASANLDGVNIGFLGGRFDPVHLGHLGAVQDALHQHRLDRVIFVPTAQVPHQSQRVHAAVEDRLAMLHLAIAGQLHWEISDFELGRPGASYTVDSVRHFRRLHPAERLFWIIGSDQLAQLHQWRSIRELAVLIEFIVVARPGHPRQPAGEIPALRLHHCNGRLSGTSATELRDRVKHGRPIAHLVPEAVAEYIVRRALYLGGDP